MKAPVMRALFAATVLIVAGFGLARPAHAQGCIIIRNNEPLFGEKDSLPSSAKEWQFYMQYRDLTADHHYNGTVYQAQREEQHNNVINRQRILDLSATYSVTPRLGLAFSVPLVDASWSIPLPVQPVPGTRRKQSASGLGDISATARYWMLDPGQHPRGNWSAGLGIKAPTGDYRAEDDYPDLSGGNISNKAVDQSIQPGDGGWGLLVSLQAYKQAGHATLFGAGTYLANPRDTNGTPSIIAGLGLSGNPAFADLLVNSVPDQYLVRVGLSAPLLKNRLSGSVAFRAEGVPRYDLIGDSHGWRRPGYETYAEPGLTYTSGRSSWSIYVPIGLVRNRRPNPYTGNPGDATFPSYVVLIGYSYRFQGQAAPPMAN